MVDRATYGWSSAAVADARRSHWRESLGLSVYVYSTSYVIAFVVRHRGESFNDLRSEKTRYTLHFSHSTVQYFDLRTHFRH